MTKTYQILKSTKIKHIFYYILGIIIIIPILIYIDIDKIRRIPHLQIGFLFLSFVFTVFLNFLDAIRWAILTNELKGHKVCSYVTYIKTYAFSASLGKFVSQLGGLFIARPVIMKKLFSLDYKSSAISIFIEKVADFYFILILFVNSLIYFLFDFESYITIGILIFSFFLGWIIYYHFAYLIEKLAFKVLNKYSRVRNKMIPTQLSINKTDFSKVKSHKKIGILSIGRYIPLFFRIIFLVKAINLSIEPLVFLFGLPISQLSLIISITPGALGFLEGGWLAVFSIAGIEKSTTGIFLIAQRIMWLIFNAFILLFTYISARDILLTLKTNQKNIK